VSVLLLSSPTFSEEHSTFLQSINANWQRDEISTAAENLIEFAGRVCYLSFGKGRQAPGSNADYIKRLISQGHESVLEHASWSFLITGITRSFTHQLVRHRIGFSFSQLSQQYHDESTAEFLPPPGLEADTVLFQKWQDVVRRLASTYNELLQTISAGDEMPAREALRLRRSIARSVLPNATETAIVVTANARALRHFLDVRGSVLGDLEMRLVSQVLLQRLKHEAPSVFADFVEETADDGWPLIRKIEGKPTGTAN
jgi:thymidylate synthase (FAD)